MATQASIRVAVNGYRVIGKCVADAVTLQDDHGAAGYAFVRRARSVLLQALSSVSRVRACSLIHSSFVGVLALTLSALVSAQRQPAPGSAWSSSAVAFNRDGLDSADAAKLAASTGFAGRQPVRFFCGSGSQQVGYPAESGIAAYPIGGEGAVGSGNSSPPAFSKFTKSAGPGGIGIEYLSRNNGFGVSGQGTGDIYRFDRAGFHRTECDLTSTRVRPRLLH